MKGKRVFDSMAAAAGALGVSKDTLRAAKESPDGAKIFRGSRVDEEEFLKWAEQHQIETSPGDVLTLRDQKIAEEIRKLKIRNDKDAGKLIARVEVAAAIRRALASVAGIIEAKIVGEWPSAVAGLDPAQARVYGRRLYDEVMAQCELLKKEFPE